MVEVVITTLEVLKADFKELVTIEWEILIVDEAHNLKNHKSRLAQNLRNVMFRHSLLLTGTPIQVSSLHNCFLLNRHELSHTIEIATFRFYCLE